MSLPAKVKIPPEILSRQIADETVILDVASGKYFGLDPVGARVWQLLGEGKTPDQVSATLATEYDVDPQRLEADIGSLLQELSANGLLKTE